MNRIPAVDGLRAVAIAMVVGYHIDKDAVPAGYWGVIVFFVLSGYLITRLLCAESDLRGRVGLRRFYAHRALRLLPALIVVCLVLLVAGTAWPAVSAALGHYANYARIAGTDLGRLTHTWFLAVLAHFYVVWPLAIAATPRRHRVRVVGALAVGAVAWRVIAIGMMSPGWVYNASDTNAAAILVGCFLAVVEPRRWRLAGSSLAVLLALMFLPAFGEEGAAFLWGDFVAIALGAIALQYALSRPSWMETPGLVWLGTISYGIYLWHYVYLRSGLTAWLAVPLAVATSAVSWYLIEEPIRRWRRRREGHSGRWSETVIGGDEHHDVALEAPRSVA